MESGNGLPSLTHFLDFVLPYVKRINSLEYRKLIEVDEPWLTREETLEKVAGGVYGFLHGPRLKLFAPGSFSLKTEWEIEAPISSLDPRFGDYCF